MSCRRREDSNVEEEEGLERGGKAKLNAKNYQVTRGYLNIKL